MALSVIGAGFGRNGTLSLKHALDELGVGPCYHMMEVFGRPAAPGQWLDFFEGRPVDWPAVFEGYGSTVDWPSTGALTELADFYPDAKIVLTTRDSEGWYKSVNDTIFSDLTFAHRPEPWRLMASAMVRFTFGTATPDKARMIESYEAHNAAVRRAFGADRLLDFQISQGWEPLCRFLKLPVPAVPFPRVNSTDEFKERVASLATPVQEG